MKIVQENQRTFMQQALQLAAQRRGFCAPNPAVGAVVVKDNQVIGEGTHWACGHPHAEVMALQSVGKAAEGATLYVTLEPCSHHGRTPPCTDLIKQSGVHEVIFAVRDPNPKVSGQGAQILQQAGISCRQLICPDVENFYQSYRYWLTQQLPWVTIKLAMSLDGKIAGFQGAPLSLTGESCRRFTHQQRLHSDAILTTVATIIADDPQLNVRLEQETIAKPLHILDSQLRLPLDAQVFRTAKSITIFHTAAAPLEKRAQFEKMNVRTVVVDSDERGLNLPAVLAVIGKDGCHDLWVEAGSRCFQRFLEQSLAHQAFIYVAPKILGNTATPAFSSSFLWSASLNQISWSGCGEDAIAKISFVM